MATTLLTATLAQATHRMRPDEAFARGALDVPSWVVASIGAALALGAAVVLLHRARKR